VQPAFWNAIAPDWDNQIFDTLAEDGGGVISGSIHRMAQSAGTAADFGCGVGRYLPLLAANFSRVLALDSATACLDRARRKARRLPNVEVLRASPSILAGLRDSCDCTLAVQVLIHPQRQARQRTLADLVSLTRRGGWVLLVVPSLESVVYAEAVRRTFRPKLKPEFGFGQWHVFRDPSVVALEGQPTKHYVAEELMLLLRKAGCIPEAPRRVEYSWRVHDAGVPRGFRAPRPWDWLVLARRG
jgi:SAM-dependent methyltransferase